MSLKTVRNDVFGRKFENGGYASSASVQHIDFICPVHACLLKHCSVNFYE